MNFEIEEQEEIVYVNLEKNLYFSEFNINYHNISWDKKSLDFKLHNFHRYHTLEARVNKTGLDAISIDSIRQHLNAAGVPISKWACINITFRSELTEFRIQTDE